MNSFFYSTELTYYSTSSLCKVIVNRSGFNASDVHVSTHVPPSNGSKNKLNNYLSIPLMP